MAEENKNRFKQKDKRNFPLLISIIAIAIVLVALFFAFQALNNDEQTDSQTPVDEPIDETPIDETPAKETPSSEETPIKETPDKETLVTEQSYADEYRRYFKKDKATAYFEGDGIEYSSFYETTNWLDDQYVSITVDNGGATTQTIYRITKNRLAKVLFEMVDQPKLNYTRAELQALPEIEVIFRGPIENKKTTDGKTITTNVTFSTPYKTFNDAVVIKEVSNGSTNETVYAPGYGHVGTVFVSEDNYKVTSLLKSIE